MHAALTYMYFLWLFFNTRNKRYFSLVSLFDCSHISLEDHQTYAQQIAQCQDFFAQIRYSAEGEPIMAWKSILVSIIFFLLIPLNNKTNNKGRLHGNASLSNANTHCHRKTYIHTCTHTYARRTHVHVLFVIIFQHT